MTQAANRQPCGVATSPTFGPDRQTRECECCHAPIERAWNFIYSDGNPYTVYFANCGPTSPR
ncbi:hypothetical protein SALB_05218 [Streptomyces noursei]|uniref:Uncharacterized protein n=1 Tax=Streptomyces noursei TaxID=1971 RepID=A0A401R477_STRNR|nr:hypothetical protein SALB_05218 [Streptomyces noursei]